MVTRKEYGRQRWSEGGIVISILLPSYSLQLSNAERSQQVSVLSALFRLLIAARDTYPRHTPATVPIASSNKTPTYMHLYCTNQESQRRPQRACGIRDVNGPNLGNRISARVVVVHAHVVVNGSTESSKASTANSGGLRTSFGG